MKQFLTIFLAVLLLLPLFGCKQSDPGEDLVAFYYKARDIKYDPQFSPLEAEHHSKSDFTTWEQALKAYLAGPEDSNLVNPFPAGLTLISFQEDSGALALVLSNDLSALTGTELTIACCCIAKTCLEMTGAERISISAETELLDGERSITLDHETINLLDHTQ